MSRPRLGEILMEMGVINEAQLKIALDDHKKWDKRIGESLIDLGFANEIQIAKALSQSLQLSVIDITKIASSSITQDLLSIIPLEIARASKIVPIAIREVRARKRLIVATADPTNYKVLDDLQFKSGFPLVVMISIGSHIDWFISKYYLRDEEAIVENFNSLKSQKISIDPVSDIFDDTNFTSVTNAYRLKREKPQ